MGCATEWRGNCRLGASSSEASRIGGFTVGLASLRRRFCGGARPLSHFGLRPRFQAAPFAGDEDWRASHRPRSLVAPWCPRVVHARIGRAAGRVRFVDFGIGLGDSGRSLRCQNRRPELIDDQQAPADRAGDEQHGGNAEQIVLQLFLQEVDAGRRLLADLRQDAAGPKWRRGAAAAVFAFSSRRSTERRWVRTSSNWLRDGVARVLACSSRRPTVGSPWKWRARATGAASAAGLRNACGVGPPTVCATFPPPDRPSVGDDYVAILTGLAAGLPGCTRTKRENTAIMAAQRARRISFGAFASLSRLLGCLGLVCLRVLVGW